MIRLGRLTENHMERKIKNYMETGLAEGFKGILIRVWGLGAQTIGGGPCEMYLTPSMKATGEND